MFSNGSVYADKLLWNKVELGRCLLSSTSFRSARGNPAWCTAKPYGNKSCTFHETGCENGKIALQGQFGFEFHHPFKHNMFVPKHIHRPHKVWSQRHKLST